VKGCRGKGGMMIRCSNTVRLIMLKCLIDLGLTKGLNDGKGDDFDSDEESPGNEDSDFSEKMGIERKLIRPQIKPDAKHLLHKDKKDEN